MLVDERADGRTCAAIEAIEGGVDPELFQFFSKLRGNQSHFSSFPEGVAYWSCSAGLPANSRPPVIMPEISSVFSSANRTIVRGCLA